MFLKQSNNYINSDFWFWSTATFKDTKLPLPKCRKHRKTEQTIMTTYEIDTSQWIILATIIQDLHFMNRESDICVDNMMLICPRIYELEISSHNILASELDKTPTFLIYRFNNNLIYNSKQDHIWPHFLMICVVSFIMTQISNISPIFNNQLLLEVDKYAPDESSKWRRVNARFPALYKALLVEPDAATREARPRQAVSAVGWWEDVCTYT